MKKSFYFNFSTRFQREFYRLLAFFFLQTSRVQPLGVTGGQRSIKFTVSSKKKKNGLHVGYVDFFLISIVQIRLWFDDISELGNRLARIAGEGQKRFSLDFQEDLGLTGVLSPFRAPFYRPVRFNIYSPFRNRIGRDKNTK